MAPYEIALSGIGYAPEESEIFADLTTLENIEIATWTRETSRQQKRGSSLLILYFLPWKGIRRGGGHRSVEEREKCSPSRELLPWTLICCCSMSPSKGSHLPSSRRSQRVSMRLLRWVTPSSSLNRTSIMYPILQTGFMSSKEGEIIFSGKPAELINDKAVLRIVAGASRKTHSAKRRAQSGKHFLPYAMCTLREIGGSACQNDKIQKELQEAIIKGKRDAVEPLIRQALSEGLNPEEIMNHILIPAMDVVGEQFSRNEIFLPEMMIAARAMNIGLDILRPMLIAKGVSSRGKVIIGTVKGDIHDVGKNIVSMVLQGAGYEVMDLGIDVPTEKFVEAINQYQPKFVLMSALITLTMSMMEDTIKALKKAGVREKVKVGVGGAPLTQSFADRIGADFYGKDARAAVIKCNEYNLNCGR